MDSVPTSEICCRFMAEIKDRLQEIEFRLCVIQDRPKSPGAHFEAEFCYLQIRYICELIVLSSLAAHHSLGLNKELMKAYHADKIFEKLESINPFCFPTSVRSVRDTAGLLQFFDGDPKAMTRKNLKDVYNQCGTMLHRGFLKHALNNIIKTYEPGKIEFWRGEILKLLSEHTIYLQREERVLFVNLSGGQDGSVLVIQAVADAVIPPNVPNF
jgi:hypothetical protein